MANIDYIRVVYHHCGLAAAIETAIKFVAIDIMAILAFAGYLMTLPFQFFWLLYRRVRDGRL